MKRYIKYIKILGILIFALLLSKTISQNIFIANTPHIRSDLKQYMAYLRKDPIKIIEVALLNGPDAIDKNTIAKIDELKKRLVPITKGVRAASEGNVNVVEFDDNNIEWMYTNYTLSDGRKITVRSARGLPIPPKILFENQKKK